MRSGSWGQIGRASCRERVCNDVSLRDWSSDVCSSDLSSARTGRMILVEGYTDVLALHQAGLRNAVGIMGTALTEEQVAELERVVQVIELCLDADRAGQE